MAKINKQLVTGKDNDGKKQTVAVIKPRPTHTRESQKVYNRVFRDALESGALLRQKLGSYMEEQGLWNDDKQKEYDKTLTAILDKEKTLKKGGIKLSEAKDMAIQMAEDRVALRDLISEKTMMDANTAEGQADNTRFNYLMACCIVDPDTGKPIFADEDGNPSLEAYEESADNEYIADAASKLAEMMYGLDDDYEANLPENKFLKKFNFVNEDLKLVNEEGQLVDTEGRLVNKDGRFINKDGDFIDIEGNPVSEDGEYIVDEQPFLDDDGNVLVVEEKTKKKRTSKKTQETSAS